jgi:putative heme-binding domain-containing protein
MLSSRLASGAALLLAGLVAQGAVVRAGQNPAQAEHPGQYAAADLAIGARVYATNCAGCHGPTGTGVGGIDLRRGPLPRAQTDAALRALLEKGLPLQGMPAPRLAPGEIDPLIAFIRSGFETGVSPAAATATPAAGDAARGRLVFETKGRCLGCHRVHDAGQFMGPDLTEIGRLRSPAALERTLIDPTASMQPINRPVRAVTRGGTVITGRRLNEDLFTVQIVTSDGRLVSLVKPDLKEWTVSTTSTMPSYKDTLTSAEFADLLGYLVSLKGGRP